MISSNRLIARAAYRVPIALSLNSTTSTQTISNLIQRRLLSITPVQAPIRSVSGFRRTSISSVSTQQARYQSSNRALTSTTTPATTTPTNQTMLPSHRLLARAFRRVPSQTTRAISTDATGKWEGRKPKDHTARETDTHNVQQDAVREGKAERAASSNNPGNEEGKSRGTSEKAGDSMDKAKKEFPEAPDVAIGMQDERGGVSSPFLG